MEDGVMQRMIWGLAACLIGSLAGCGSDTAGDKNGSDHKGTIGVSVLTLRNPFFKVIGDNITAGLTGSTRRDRWGGRH
jgi:hypothetical protein